MNPHATRRQNIFDPKSEAPFELSRSKIELYFSCPRCLYLDRRLGVSPPQLADFKLYNAIDEIMKREFDVYRERSESHPVAVAAGVDAVPFSHPDLDTWRNPFKGVRHHHTESNFIVFGGVDDVWQDSDDALVVVDYKSTCVPGKPDLDKSWHDQYRRQIEVYQWLFRENGFDVSETGYFVFANAKDDAATFDGALNFDLSLVPHEGDTSWIDSTLSDIRTLLSSDTIPSYGKWCNLCPYRDAAGNSFRHHAS